MGGEPGLKLVQSERSLGGAVVLVRVEVEDGFARIGEGAIPLQRLCDCGTYGSMDPSYPS